MKSNVLISNTNSRQKSPLRSAFRRRDEHDEELVRSSSCGDLPSSKSERTRHIHDQFLIRIQTISKQIRMRYYNTINGKLFLFSLSHYFHKPHSDPECTHLWNELEKSLSSALSHAANQHCIENSFKPLRNEINELRK